MTTDPSSSSSCTPNVAASPPHGEYLDSASIRFERILPGPIERLWSYIVDPAKRGLWLAQGTTDLKVGGKIELEFHNSKITPHVEPIPPAYVEISQDGAGFTATITRCEPPHLLSHTWGDGSEVTFELVSVSTQQDTSSNANPNGSVKLTLTHRRVVDRATVLDISGGWHTHLAILEAKLRGETPPPFWATFLPLHEEYRKRLPSA